MVGLGGIGVSALARLFVSQGKEVSGSDGQNSEITNALKDEGILFFLGHKTENLPDDADLLIYSPAVPEENQERQKAERLNIVQLSYPEALGILSRGKYTIAVSGTDGKSTTTALAGLMLADAWFDPTVIVGSKVKKFNENLRLGNSEYLIVEACEYRENMLNLSPTVIILTNITPDHLDYYKNLENILWAFEKYITLLPSDGKLVINADDKNCQRVARLAKCSVLTFGVEGNGELQARNIRVQNQSQVFEIIFKGESLGEFSLNAPGIFNVSNALAAMRLALELSVPVESIKKTLSEFSGIWRRFEILGKSKNGALVISDYAHTPKAVAGTIKAAKEFYPDKKIIAIFQPHHRSRTKELFDDFVSSFDFADAVVLSEVYDVAGREEAKDADISSADLAKEISKKTGKEIVFAKDLSEAGKMTERYDAPNSLFLFMGAGDIYMLAESLILG